MFNIKRYLNIIKIKNLFKRLLLYIKLASYFPIDAILFKWTFFNYSFSSYELNYLYYHSKEKFMAARIIADIRNKSRMIRRPDFEYKISSSEFCEFKTKGILRGQVTFSINECASAVEYFSSARPY